MRKTLGEGEEDTHGDKWRLGVVDIHRVTVRLGCLLLDRLGSWLGHLWHDRLLGRDNLGWGAKLWLIVGVDNNGLGQVLERRRLGLRGVRWRCA